MRLHQHGRKPAMRGWRGRDGRRLNEDRPWWRLNSSFVSWHGDGSRDLAGDTLVQFNVRNVCLCSSVSAGDPHNDPNAQGDAFKTLFVARVVSVFCTGLRNVHALCSSQRRHLYPPPSRTTIPQSLSYDANSKFTGRSNG